MLEGIIIAIALGMLVAAVVYFVVLPMKNIVDRVKKLRETSKNRVVIQDAQKLMSKAMEEAARTSTEISTEDLLKLFGEDGVVEAVVSNDGTVNPDDITILKTDKKDEKLSNFLDQNNGVLVIN